MSPPPLYQRLGELLRTMRGCLSSAGEDRRWRHITHVWQ